mgnify:CR=1 FL=1
MSASLLVWLLFTTFAPEEMYFSNTYLHIVHIVDMLSLPVFFIITNMLCLFVSKNVFAHPNYFENNTVTSYFCEKFNISKRESEIASYVVQGMSNKEISCNTLFISIKTVEAHLYSCYRKTDVKNRIQFMNLIKAN